MRSTMTLRLPAGLQRKLGRAAAAGKKTPSQLVRELLEAFGQSDEAERTLGERTGHLLGCISSGAVVPGREARAALAAWVPNRRGR